MVELQFSKLLAGVRFSRPAHMQFIFILMTFISTFLGGLFGLRYKEKIHLILGLTAGIILGVIAFDIFPEIIELTNKLGVSPIPTMIALVAGFMVFHIAEKVLLIHHSHEDQYGPHTHPTVGKFQALALAGHSFLDGVGVGLGFQISPETGVFVAIAVVAHDFADGLNTVRDRRIERLPTVWKTVVLPLN